MPERRPTPAARRGRPRVAARGRPPTHHHAQLATPAAPLAGEILLVGAVLRRALEDARTRPDGQPAAGVSPDQWHEARAFLRDPARLAFWCALVGAEWEALRRTLQRHAGLAGEEAAEYPTDPRRGP